MKKIRRQVTLLIITFTLAFIICGAVSAADEPTNATANGTVVDPPLEITKGSWDTAGLDSNDVTVGPDQTIIQFRVKNPDPVNTAHDVTSTFAWTSTNTYINLVPGETVVKNIGDILPGETKDVFYLVEIDRDSNAYFTSRNYQLTIAGSDTPTYTPTGSIYVEKLLSQNRNDILSLVVSPENPQVGSTFTVTMFSQTGSKNYNLVNLPIVEYDPTVVKPLGLITTYTDNNGIDQTSNNVKIDNPLADYFKSVWTFEVLSAGISDFYGLITDKSGSSYHYNADYSEVTTIYVPAEMGNYVWYDQDADGIQDAAEQGVPNVVVNLYNSTGAKLDTKVTDANGYYYFTNIYPGDYFVEFELPAGYLFSPQDKGADDTIDSDANPANGRTIITTLDPGEKDYTWDAGIYNTGSIGDFVWEDQNANGIYEGLGPGVAGVTVNLLDGLGNFIASTVTDGDGYYLFSGLTPGNYIVEFVPLPGYQFSPQDQGLDNTKDSDANTATGRTAIILLVAGVTDLTWDAAIYRTASIGDFVWEDQNANGIYEGLGPGVAGATVNLLDGLGNFIASTVTDASGYYLFSGLTPGDYCVNFILPTDFLFSSQDQGADDTIDSDADTSTGRTATTTLTSGETDNTWDAGIYQLATIGDFVWNDTNYNGIQNAGEPGIGSVIVRLYSSTSVLLATTTTDTNGYYQFTNLPPGNYFLEFIVPGSVLFSPQDQGGDDAIDSDGNPINANTARTATTTLTSGETDNTWDLGIIPQSAFYASIGDFVWEDQNANGIYDGLGPGVAGVTVNLLDGLGNFISSTITDANGYYQFINLNPGNYIVEFVLPTGYLFSPQDQGLDNTKDSDANPANGRTGIITLGLGQTDLTWDAAIYRTASIGNFVWNDQNANGIYEGIGPGVAGVTVNLLDGLGNFIATTVTDASGYYLFSGLTPGNYIVEFVSLTGYQFSPQDQGADDTLDNDADTSTGRTTTITLTSNESDLTRDAAIYQFVTIGDFVWKDLNVNGIQDAGEPGIEDVIVKLYSDLSTLLATTTTDVNGYYQFTNLLPGDYFLEFVLPEGYKFVPQDQGADNVDSDANTVKGQTAITNLTSGETDNTWDAGMYQPASIGSFVWNDQNANGIFEGRGTGVPGVTVRLLDGLGNIIASTTTDANGFYLFSDLLPGDYMLEFVLPTGFLFSPQNQGADDTIDSDPNPSNGRTGIISLVQGVNDLEWDAAIYQPVDIGNFIWNDINRNGIQDAGEPGIANVVVELYNAITDAFVATTTTDANGYYLFEDQRPNVYYLKFIKPTGYVFVPENVVFDDTIDSDAYASMDGKTVATELTSGETDLTWDAGFAVQQADLEITKTVDKTPITVEQNAKFTLVVKNNGPDTAVNVKVTDALPDGLEYVSYHASPGTYYDPLTNVWTIGDMVNGSSATLKLVAKATKTGVFTNIAVVSSDTEDPNLENNRDTASLTVREPVKAVTVPMQPTGLPIGYLVIAVLMVLAGTLIPKRK